MTAAHNHNATAYSLADFYFTESDDPLQSSPEFLEWRKAAQWAFDLYEPHLHGPPVPVVEVSRAGKRRRVVNLSSYNYLGFAAHPEVIREAQKALKKYGTGTCGSPLLSGLSDLHRRLEERLAAFMGRESAMLFNSGFAGAMGALAGILRKGDVAILDAKCHLSLIAGVSLAHARLKFFDHNNPESLEATLNKSRGKRRIVVVEGVYSMDGDMADLPALLEVTERHGVGVFIDEAHSILIYGDSGRGVTQHFGVGDRVGMIFATLSKAFASLGGFIAGSKDILDYIRYYSHPYGFSCALPPALIAGILKVLDIVEDNPSLRQKVWENTRFVRDNLQRLGVDPKLYGLTDYLIRGLNGPGLRRKLLDNTEYFRSGLVSLGLNLGESQSQVIPIIIGSDRNLLYELCHEMFDKGLFLPPVDYPSVPEDGLRYRAVLTTAHSRRDLDRALQIIEDTLVPRLR